MGSYVLCIALRCILHAVGDSHPDPLALHCQFFASPPLGSTVEIRVTERRKGRALAFVDAEVLLPPSDKKGGPAQAQIAAHAVLGKLPPPSAQVLTPRFQPPAQFPPPPENCIPMNPFLFPGLPLPKDTDEDPSFYRSMNFLGDPTTMTLASSNEPFPPDNVQPELNSLGPLWIFHPDGRKPDVHTLTFVTDFPAPFNLVQMNRSRPAQGLAALAPSTVSLSVHFHAHPTGQKLVHSSAAGIIGFGQDEFKHDVEYQVWDETGKLCATSRQVQHMSVISPPKTKM